LLCYAFFVITTVQSVAIEVPINFITVLLLQLPQKIYTGSSALKGY